MRLPQIVSVSLLSPKHKKQLEKLIERQKKAADNYLKRNETYKMLMKDKQDLDFMVALMDAGNFKKAAQIMENMDTDVCDHIPASVYNFLQDILYGEQ